MARMALGAVGAVVGFIWGGGPSGAQAGWVIGSAVGGMFEPPIQGPRLNDLQVQVSSYGVALPITYGGDRIPGNVIWCTNLVEHAETTSGKGGPSIENHTYTLSCAIAINGREIGGVRKIWADAKLIYDISEDADDGARAASSKIAALMTVYTGTETQLPDPVIESHEGIGNVEAYRGVAYVVFKDLPLADYGNRMPQFTFELTSDTPVTVVPEVLAPLTISPWTIGSVGPMHSVGETRWSVTGPDGIPRSTTDPSMVLAMVREAFANEHLQYIGYQTFSSLPDYFGRGVDLNGGVGGATDVLALFNVAEPDVIVNDDHASESAGLYCSLLAQSGAVPDSGVVYAFSKYSDGLMALAGVGSSPPPGWDGPVYANNCVMYPPVGGSFPHSFGRLHSKVYVERLLSPPASTCQPGDPCDLGIAQIPGNPNYCISCAGDISPNYSYVLQTGTYRQLQTAVFTGGTSITALPKGPVLAAGDPLDTREFWEAAAAAAGVAGVYGTDFPKPVSQVGVAVDGSSTANPGAVALSFVVADICARSGLAPTEIDATGLVGTVPGYTITRQAPGRGDLAPLASAWRFVGIESGRKIVFRHIDDAAVATLGPDDLGATADGQPTSLVKRTRAQETELPAVVNVAYKSREADYQAGAQSARRSAGGSRQEQVVEIPVVLDDQFAANIAARVLYEAWAGRVKVEWATTRRWVDLEPGDPVLIDDGEFVHRVMITDKVEDGALIKWTGHDLDPAVALATGSVSPVSGGGSTVRFDGPMKLVPLDLPLLRAADDMPAVLLAAAGYRTDWRGGRVSESFDNVNWATLADITSVAAIGYTSNALAGFGGGNTVDESGEIVVRMHSGALAGVARDALLDGISNAFAVGAHGRWEILQAQRAVLVEEGVYRLTGLLRGRMGSEAHMGSHQVGDLLVMLDAEKLTRASQQVDDIGRAASLKAVSYGTTLADVTAQPFTYAAVNLQPLAPVQLAAIPLADGTLLARWRRRSRQTVAWLSAAALPLAEASEQYLVTVLDGSTVLEQRTVTTSSCVLAAGHDGKTLRVQQVSAVVGPGAAAEVTIVYPIYVPPVADHGAEFEFTGTFSAADGFTARLKMLLSDMRATVSFAGKASFAEAATELALQLNNAISTTPYSGGMTATPVGDKVVIQSAWVIESVSAWPQFVSSAIELRQEAKGVELGSEERNIIDLFTGGSNALSNLGVPTHSTQYLPTGTARMKLTFEGATWAAKKAIGGAPGAGWGRKTYDIEWTVTVGGTSCFDALIGQVQTLPAAIEAIPDLATYGFGLRAETDIYLLMRQVLFVTNKPDPSATSTGADGAYSLQVSIGASADYQHPSTLQPFPARISTGVPTFLSGAKQLSTLALYVSYGYSLAAGQQFTVTLDGTPYTYTAAPGDTTVANVYDGLAALINAGSDFHAARYDTLQVLEIERTVVNTQFTASFSAHTASGAELTATITT